MDIIAQVGYEKGQNTTAKDRRPWADDLHSSVSARSNMKLGHPTIIVALQINHQPRLAQIRVCQTFALYSPDPVCNFTLLITNCGNILQLVVLHRRQC